MSFGRTINKLKKKAAGDSLIEIIHAEIAKTPHMYSFEDVKLKAKIFANKVYKSDAPDDEIWSAFYELFDSMFAPRERSGKKFHPSEMDDLCWRKMYYDLTGVKISDPNAGKPSVDLQKIFDIGTYFHAYIQAKLFRSGVLKKSEVRASDKSLDIDGHTDGILEIKGEQIVLEIKTIATHSFNKLTAPLKKHVKQASIYAKILGIKRIYFLYINKETGAYVEFLVNRDDASINDDIKTIKEIKKHITDKKLPERLCENRFVNRALNCPFSTHCFKTKN